MVLNRNWRHAVVMASCHSHNGQPSCDLHLITKHPSFRPINMSLPDYQISAHGVFLGPSEILFGLVHLLQLL